MATTTTNLGLTKPAYADTADIDVINGNMDILDGAVNAVEGGIAIISNNNTHAAVSKGQYVYVRKHSTLAEGIYRAKSNIAVNGTLNTSNLETVSGGLGGDVSSLSDALNNSNITTDGIILTNCTLEDGGFIQIGSLIVVNMRITVTVNISAYTTFIYFPKRPKSSLQTQASIASLTSDDANTYYLVNTGAVRCKQALTSGVSVTLSCTYITG